MSTLFRSAEMDFYKLVLPAEAGYPFIRAFSAMEAVMFEDQNKNAIVKPFASAVKRIDDLLAKITTV